MQFISFRVLFRRIKAISSMMKDRSVPKRKNCLLYTSGIKDCSNCLVPHSPKGYDYVTSKYSEILELAKKK